MHWSSPWQEEVKFLFRDVFRSSCERKTGVKLESKWSSLLPKRLVPLIFPKTHYVMQWWWHQGGAPAIFRCVCPLCVLCAKSLQSRLTLCGPMDYSSPGSSVHGILQVRILKWVAMPSSRGSSQIRDQNLKTTSPVSPALAGKYFTTTPLRPAESQSMMLKLPHSQIF